MLKSMSALRFARSCSDHSRYLCVRQTHRSTRGAAGRYTGCHKRVHQLPHRMPWRQI